MAWVYLFCASIAEMTWVVSIKYSEGFTKLVPSVILVIGMTLSVGFLGLAVKTLPLGTAYAIWTGVGALGAVTYGMLYFGDPVSLPRIIFLSMIAIGVVGLKLVSTN